MVKIFGKKPLDTVNLYLVADNIKPATLISSPTYKDLADFVNSRNIPYKHKKQVPKRDQLNENGERIATVYGRPYHSFTIASDDDKLARLLNATTEADVGRALGYPEESARNYRNKVGDEVRNGNYMMVQLARAKKEGISIPSWFQYISFVPWQFDLVSGEIDEASINLGLKYQAHIRENYPELAYIVENTQSERLPDSWKLNPNGNYRISTYHPTTIREVQ